MSWTNYMLLMASIQGADDAEEGGKGGIKSGVKEMAIAEWC